MSPLIKKILYLLVPKTEKRIFPLPAAGKDT